jgi:hypothetical protein
VFVDDADHSGRDWSGIGILVAALVGVLGMAMSLSGGYELHGGGGPGTAAIEPGGVTASDGRSAPASDQPRIEVSEGPVDESE